jgi:predicted nucleotidyltransferase component of viral defense system
MSKEQALAQIQSMSIEDILAKGLYVIAEEIKDQGQKLIDVFYFKDEAREAFKQLREFDSDRSKTKLLSPKKLRVA